MVLLGAIVLAACVGGVIYYLIADQEHGVNSDTQVAQVCALGRQVGFPVLIRPIDTETSTIRLAIDRGPCGLLLPTVESATQLDRVRDSIWMPPRGKRVPGGRATTGRGISATRRGRPAWRMTSSFCRRSNRGRDWSASTKSPPTRSRRRWPSGHTTCQWNLEWGRRWITRSEGGCEGRFLPSRSAPRNTATTMPMPANHNPIDEKGTWVRLENHASHG